MTSQILQRTFTEEFYNSHEKDVTTMGIAETVGDGRPYIVEGHHDASAWRPTLVWYISLNYQRP